MKETEIDEEITENADTDTDETAVRNEKAAAKSDTKTEKRDKQTVTAAMTEAAAMMIAEIDIKTEKVMSFEFKKNIRLLAVIQMMLRVLLISQMSLLCFHAD